MPRSQFLLRTLNQPLPIPRVRFRLRTLMAVIIEFALVLGGFMSSDPLTGSMAIWVAPSVGRSCAGDIRSSS